MVTNLFRNLLFVGLLILYHLHTSLFSSFFHFFFVPVVLLRISSGACSTPVHSSGVDDLRSHRRRSGNFISTCLCPPTSAKSRPRGSRRPAVRDPLSLCAGRPVNAVNCIFVIFYHHASCWPVWFKALLPCSNICSFIDRMPPRLGVLSTPTRQLLRHSAVGYLVSDI